MYFVLYLCISLELHERNQTFWMPPILHSFLTTLMKAVFPCYRYAALLEKLGIQKTSKYIMKI